MKSLEILRAKQAELVEVRDAAIEAMETVATAALEEERSLSSEDDSEIAAQQTAIADLDEQLSALDEREDELIKIETRTAERASRPTLQVMSSPDPVDILEDRSATSQQLADAVTRSLEGRVDSPENEAHVRNLVLKHRGDRDWARGLVARATEDYESGWAKAVTGRQVQITNEERTALSTVTDANGNFLVPTHLDPTVILTNDGTTNAIRGISRVVTLTRPGDSSWQGISSAGVTAAFGAQLAETTDGSPTFLQPTVPLHRASALVVASIEAVEDIAGLASELLAMFSDARDRVEATAHATGTGTNQPTGVFTAVDAAAGSEVTSASAAAIAKADIDSLYRGLPVRHRGQSTWVTHPIWSLAVQNIGTAVSANYSANLADGPSPMWLGRPVVESDDAPSAATTTALDNEILFGDFSNYVIADKPGSFSVDYIPTMFNDATTLPDGSRGWFAYWRNGADSVNDDAFRLLQDETSA